jgi:hypothetical protein
MSRSEVKTMLTWFFLYFHYESVPPKRQLTKYSTFKFYSNAFMLKKTKPLAEQMAKKWNMDVGSSTVVASLSLVWLILQTENPLERGKGKVPVLIYLITMPWRHMGEWRYSSTILDLSTRWWWLASFMPWPLYPLGKPLVPTEQEARWAPELVWILQSREKISYPCQQSNPSCPAQTPLLYQQSCPGSCE